MTVFFFEVFWMHSHLKKRRVFPMRFIIFVFVLSLGFTANFAQTVKSSNSGATKQLYALFNAEWEYDLKSSPTFASSQGDRRYNDKWTDNSLSALAKRHRHNIGTLSKIEKIDRSKLSVSDKLNYDLFKKDYEQSIERYKFKGYLLPINQRGGIQTASRPLDLYL